MSHIVKSCPLTKLNGGLSRLHSADEDAVSWLTSYRYVNDTHTRRRRRRRSEHIGDVIDYMEWSSSSSSIRDDDGQLNGLGAAALFRFSCREPHVISRDKVLSIVVSLYTVPSYNRATSS